MSFSRWLDKLFRRSSPTPTPARNRRRIPTVEILEDRLAPATYTVTSLVDSTQLGSLRYGLSEVKSGDTINFQNGLSGTIAINPALGTFQVPVDVTIYGSGQNVISISGSGANTVFNVAPSLTDVKFEHLTIADGVGTTGGGVEIGKNSTVSFTNVTIGTNQNVPGLSGNQANQGGGVYVSSGGNVSFTNSTLNGNAASGLTGSFSGGGLYAAPNSTVAFTNSNVVNNSAVTDGGGIAVEGGAKVTMQGGSADNNSTAGYGGAFSSVGSVDLTSTDVSFNSAAIAGAIWSLNATGGNPGTTYAPAALTLVDSTVNSNTSTGDYGGIVAEGTMTLTSTVVDGNSAGGNIGGIALLPYSTGTITDSTVAANYVSDAQGDTGGISVYGTMTILGSTVSGNISPTDVGGIRVNDGELWLIDSTVANNTALSKNIQYGDGGGILVDSGIVNIINSTIAGNQASGRGGGIMVENPQSTTVTFTMQNSIVATNKAGAESEGPDIYTFPSAPNDTYHVQYNLIGDGSATTSDGANGLFIVAGSNNKVGGAGTSALNPLLGPLQNNGGTTDTMALLAGSPAIDVGSNALAVDNNGNTLQFDQRGLGFPRIVNSIVDMGAFEYNVPIVINPTTLPTAFVNVPYSQPITATGGSGSFSYSVTIGSLPQGLTLNPITGLLSGTPTTTAGSPFSFQVTATDNNSGATANKTYTLVVDNQLTITPTTLPAGTVGNTYTESLTPGGGSGSGYAFTETGTLPAGITFTNGNFSGTPAATGAFPIQVTLTDSAGGSVTQSYTLDVYAVLALSPATVPAAALSSPYSVTFTATGGSGTGYSYSELGALPTGITFSNGILSGTPTGSTGNFSFTVTATDSTGNKITNNYTLTVEPAIAITPATLPTGTANDVYTQSTPFSATGGNGGPYGFSETGTLPTGITFNSVSDTLTGTPTQSGSFSITITATDSAGATGSQNYTLIVNSAVTLSPTTLPAATETIYYTQAVTASGGSGSGYTYTETGTLPTGITFNTSNGTFSGTPSATGTFAITVTATDSIGGTGSQKYTLQVNLPLSLSSNPAPLPWAAENGPYSATIVASGGSGTGYTYAETSGNLPPGITFANGQLTGALIGVTSGSYTFTIQATDSNGTVGSKSFTIYAEPPITITPSTLPAGTIGSVYTSTTLTALTGAGGKGAPYTFSETGALPTGITLGSNGTLSGTPTQYGTFNITVTATDGNGGTGTQAYSLVINFNLGNSPNAKFVDAVYQQLLGRNPDPGAQGWVNLLNIGVAPSTIVYDVEHSTEYLSDVVTGLYEHYLHRAPDPGAAGWVQALANGASIEQVTASILASQEFYNDSGATMTGFLTALYKDVLGRAPDAAGLNAWLTYVNAAIVRNGDGTNVLAELRYQIALDFLTSTEYRTDLLTGALGWNPSDSTLQGYYPQFLQRQADTPGLAAWIGALQAGLSDQTVLAAIFGSAEGYGIWSVKG